MKKMLLSARKNFIAGIFLILPLLATGSILWWVFIRLVSPVVRGLLRPLMLLAVPARFHNILGMKTVFLWDFIGIILLFVFIAVLGILARTFIVKKLVMVYEKILNRIPIVNKIYGTVRQISKAFFGVERTGFKRVVLFEYPRKDSWSFGFVSGEVKGEIPGRPGEKILTIFVPTTPNPTSGYLLQVPEKDTILLDITVSEAFELIISAGLITPDFDRIIQPRRE